MIYIELFLSFLQVGLFSIGGGYAAIPLIKAEVVEARSWLSIGEFADLVTIAEMTPGPIAINSATFVGVRIAGIGGAVAATFGSIFPSLVIVSLLYYMYRRFSELPMLQSVLSSLRLAVIALIASAGVSILIEAVFGAEASGFSWTEAALFALSFLALRKFKPNPIAVLGLCGAGGLALGLIFG